MNRNTRISRNRNKNKRNRSLKQKNNRQRVSRNRRRQRVSRNRRQRGGFFTTAVAPVEESSITTQSISDVSTEQDCNLRNDASIFQSTFENTSNNNIPDLSNYKYINNDTFVLTK